jgi:uncharacterized protein (TIGR03437 family)
MWLMLSSFISKLGVVLLLCGPSYALYAQNASFLGHREIPIGPSSCCWAAISGDFNGDGKPDLVVSFGTGTVVTVGTSTLVLLLGDGSGGFKPGTVLATFNGAIKQLLAADVNRDGKLDLLVGSGAIVTGLNGAFQTYLLLGRGDGTFQSASQVVASGYPLFVADLNGDGIPDLGVQLSGQCDLQVRLGNGDGTFQKPLCLTAPEAMSGEAAIWDFNGDGIPDLIWSSGRSNGGVWLFLGNGDGTFRSPPSGGVEARGPAGSRERKVLAVGDLNHDGKLDVVVGEFNFIEVFFGKGDGTFQEGIVFPLYFEHLTDPELGHEIFIADLNGDGKPDIVTDNVVLLGNGDGTFQLAQYLLTASPGAASLVCADLNGDGRPDLVYVDYALLDQTATGLSVLLNNTPGPSSSVVGYSAATGAEPVAPLSIASIYGKNLVRTTASATGPTLSTQLGGISLRVRDITDTVRLAPLFYVSPAQINFLVPGQTAVGPVSLALDDGSPLVETANATPVTLIAPAIFTANGQGRGAAAATAVRILADGTQQPISVFNCAAPSQCSTVPIALAASQPVYLSLYGTGFRGVPPPQHTQCTVGGVSAVVQFAGAQPTIPGLDQINILLPATLASGTASVQCDFGFPIAFGLGDATTNSVQIEIK